MKVGWQGGMTSPLRDPEVMWASLCDIVTHVTVSVCPVNVCSNGPCHQGQRSTGHGPYDAISHRQGNSPE